MYKFTNVSEKATLSKAGCLYSASFLELGFSEAQFPALGLFSEVVVLSSPGVLSALLGPLLEHFSGSL